MKKPVQMIGIGSGWGASIMGTADGPEDLWGSRLSQTGQTFPERFSDKSLWTDLHEDFRPIELYQGLTGDSLSVRKQGVLKACLKASNLVQEAIMNQLFPLTVGGDHSLAAGTWWGLKSGLKSRGLPTTFGVIWIDAHLDAHTAFTTPSNAPHGMPVAGLLGAEKTIFSHLQEATVFPEHMFYVGIRSYEAQELEFLQKMGVKIYFMDDVKRLTFKGVMDEILGHFKREGIPYGISLDVDAFDPIEAPGTGAPAPDGLWSKDVFPVLNNIAQDEKCLAFEILEYNPGLDQENKTQKLIWNLTATVLGEKIEDARLY